MNDWIWLPIGGAILFALWKLEQIAERLGVIMAILKDWDRKNFPDD